MARWEVSSFPRAGFHTAGNMAARGPSAYSFGHFLQRPRAHIAKGLHLARARVEVSRARFGPARRQPGQPGPRLGSQREAKNSPKEEAPFPEGRRAGLTEPPPPLRTLPPPPQIFCLPLRFRLLKTWTLPQPLALPGGVGLCGSRPSNALPGSAPLLHKAGCRATSWASLASCGATQARGALTKSRRGAASHGGALGRGRTCRRRQAPRPCVLFYPLNSPVRGPSIDEDLAAQKG